MRVLQLHNRGSGLGGGADDVVADEAALLEGAGIDVDQYLISNRSVARTGKLQAGLSAFWNLEVAKELAGRIETKRPDLIHVHTPFPIMSPAVFRIAHRHGVPTVATAHSYRYSCVKSTLFRDGHLCELCVGSATKIPALKYRCYHDSLAATAVVAGSLATHRAIGTFQNHIDRIITLTSFARDMVVREGFSPQKVAVKPNSVADPGPPLQHDAGHALFAGRLTPEKGISTLLQAWTDGDVNLPLRIAGDGPLLELVEETARGCPEITYLGRLGRAELLDDMRHARLLIFPSQWYEAGLPLVMAQAFSCGVPVVASNVGNFTEWIEDAVNGTIFESGNPASLRDAINRTVETPVALQDMRAGARRTYDDHFRPEKNLQRLLSIYEELLDQDE